MQWQRWLLLDALWRVVAGAGIGWLVGYALMHLIFRSQRSPRISAGSDGLTALAITLFVYGVAELCGGYGFLAVFVAAVVVRQHERNHEYHTTLNLFAEQCERLLMALLLILFGGVLVSGQLGMPTLREWGFALAFVLLVRPLAGWLGMAGSGLRQGDQWAIAVFGVRGIGSLYYLAFAINHADFPEAERLWSVVCLVVLMSILLHGISAKPAMGWLDRRRQRRQRASG